MRPLRGCAAFLPEGLSRSHHEVPAYDSVRKSRDHKQGIVGGPSPHADINRQNTMETIATASDDRRNSQPTAKNANTADNRRGASVATDD